MNKRASSDALLLFNYLIQTYTTYVIITNKKASSQL